MAPLPSLSEQLRQHIEECGTSRYALCQRVGVSEAVLSRFLAGRQGLALATLDKLAEALGLALVVTTQQLPRRQPRGRKPRKDRSLPRTRRAMNWQELARSCAADAHENHFPSRRGVWHFEDLGVLVVFNNNPYDRFPTLRDEETAQFRRALKAAGLEELAYATYPADGYTYAMVVKAGEGRKGWVVETMQNIIVMSWRRMNRETRPQ